MARAQLPEWGLSSHARDVTPGRAILCEPTRFRHAVLAIAGDCAHSHRFFLCTVDSHRRYRSLFPARAIHVESCANTVIAVRPDLLELGGLGGRPRTLCPRGVEESRGFAQPGDSSALRFALLPRSISRRSLDGRPFAREFAPSSPPQPSRPRMARLVRAVARAACDHARRRGGRCFR